MICSRSSPRCERRRSAPRSCEPRRQPCARWRTGPPALTAFRSSTTSWRQVRKRSTPASWAGGGTVTVRPFRSSSARSHPCVTGSAQSFRAAPARRRGEPRTARRGRSPTSLRTAASRGTPCHQSAPSSIRASRAKSARSRSSASVSSATRSLADCSGGPARRAVRRPWAPSASCASCACGARSAPRRRALRRSPPPCGARG